MDQIAIASRTRGAPSVLGPRMLAYPPEGPATMSRSARFTTYSLVANVIGGFSRTPESGAVGAGDVVVQAMSSASGEGKR
jgi:hypothetical protein